MNCGADTLLPEGTRKNFVLARPRFLVRENIEQQANRAHVESDEDESPFHYDRFGIVAVLVKGDVERGGKGEEKQAGNEIVDRLNEHGRAPGINRIDIAAVGLKRRPGSCGSRE